MIPARGRDTLLVVWGDAQSRNCFLLLWGFRRRVPDMIPVLNGLLHPDNPVRLSPRERALASSGDSARSRCLAHGRNSYSANSSSTYALRFPRNPTYRLLPSIPCNVCSSL